MASSAHHTENIREQYIKNWKYATADNNLTLHGFRRFKTTHLLNLRFLEDEIAALDHDIYQAGLTIGLDPSSSDRLGLRHSKRDANVPKIEETITQEVILRLRSLLKEYDDALIAFNQIMSMETFSLLDDEAQSSLRTDLSLYEIYNTRLVRTDLGTRLRTDPFQRRIHKYLRDFEYWRMSKRSQENLEAPRSTAGSYVWRYQNTILLAEIAARIITVFTIGVFLIIPLASLGQQPKSIQIAIVSVFILIFSFIVTAILKVSNLEMMAVSAAYAAVLASFISNPS
ncbi:hypothetical protein ANO14919_047140 [Xylariales sp. No.14919]|nr:hypothetical protein ANO14919_047140 [Xylariales sp. No.14919]